MFRDSLQDPLFVGVSGMVRKSALLCQLHDGPAFFAPALGGVQEAGFACAWRAGPSVSQALCSSCASSLGSSRAVCAASHGPASDPGRTRLDLQAGSCRAEPRGDPCWLRAPAGAARGGTAGAGRRQNLPHGTFFCRGRIPTSRCCLGHNRRPQCSRGRSGRSGMRAQEGDKIGDCRGDRDGVAPYATARDRLGAVLGAV